MVEIIGLGIDIEENLRFKKLISNKKILSRIFTNAELIYCLSKDLPEQSLTSRFCLKEAIIKASPIKLYYNEIEIQMDDKSPKVKILKKGFSFEIKASISHTNKYSIGSVIILN